MIAVGNQTSCQCLHKVLVTDGILYMKSLIFV